MWTTEGYDYDTLDYTDGSLISLCEKEDLQSFLSFYPIVFYILFVLSITGNMMILIILLKWEKFNTVTNIFILNLVISDVLFSVTLPFTAFYISSSWIFGNVMCKLTTAFYFSGFQSFVIFLTLMTIDQYLMIVHSWSSTSRSRIQYAVNISVIAWCLSILFSLPEVILSSTKVMNTGETVCEMLTFQNEQNKWWLVIGHYKHFSLFFIIPIIIIVICYIGIALKLTTCNIRRKAKVLKLIFVIAFLFFLCWIPYNITMILMFQETIESFNNCKSVLHYVFYISQTLLYIHCCTNPLLYTFLGTKFKRYFRCSFSRLCLPRVLSMEHDISLRTSMLNAV
ncbi:hypothetical protein XENTR_v10016353 [Xenopus tropicalis]|uniref:C-C chemokine receptor type 3 n=1 Tax=Xenopus tropicalis TaxID=8364 RepID=A0A6I8SIY6_XENTR|nr:C-C chemokine receptor type 3 [Xenopus tropicalis]KAE8597092.1 hypothetical protein XENTR_v10016353 [Xenopus tropicalis]|eukprot:XP_017950357.1 PREDICTED: C-C chemokine receptor type 3-like [Xenopus tropicalis]